MKQRGCQRITVTYVVLVVVLLLVTHALFSENASPVSAFSVPGAYSSSQLISFNKPSGTRLSISVDGSPFSETESPLFLSVLADEDHEFVVETELRSLIPDSPILSKQHFIWRIDRKAPFPPEVTAKSVEGGRLITLMMSEPGIIQYQIYHPFSASFSSSSISSGETVFIPNGAFFCAIAIDLAGNRSDSASLSDSLIHTEVVPFKVINPVPGNWSNPQVLLIDSAPDTDIRYTLDGSDPSISGLVYTEPVPLDSTSITHLRVSSIDSTGKKYEERIFFTVASGEIPSVLPFNGEPSVVNLGDFSEIEIPVGFSYSIGDSSPMLEGGKAILFSAVRGTRRYYPITISDGKITLRWILASGNGVLTSEEHNLVDKVAPPLKNTDPKITIDDWYFISLHYEFPLYYSLDGKVWNLYSIPVFVDRASPCSFYWYSSAWKKSEIQTVHLPAKPAISGVPENGLSASPVFISVTDSPFSFYYEVGSDFFPALPTLFSPSLSSGFLVEPPTGSQSVFSTRILATYEGLVHGELDTRFIIDRKAPRVPSIGINPDVSYIRVPLSFTPTGEEKIEISISGKPYTSEGNQITLSGDVNRPVDYTVSLFSIDRVGNTSPVIEKKITVDLNALYVDSSYSGLAVRDGSPLYPFASLDDALLSVRGTGSWRIYVSGTTHLSLSHTIQAQVNIIGTDATIIPLRNASIVVSGGALSLSGCTISQNLDEKDSPTLFASKTDPSQFLFDIRKGSFTASNLEVNRTGLYSGSILRTSLSSVKCINSRFILSSSEYALLFDMSDSSLILESCTLSVSARNSSALSLTATKADLSRSSFFVSAFSAGRAIEAWNSQLVLKDLILELKSGTLKNIDSAIWLDGKSRVVSESGMQINGFSRYKTAASR